MESLMDAELMIMMVVMVIGVTVCSTCMSFASLTILTNDITDDKTVSYQYLEGNLDPILLTGDEVIAMLFIQNESRSVDNVTSFKPSNPSGGSEASDTVEFNGYYIANIVKYANQILDYDTFAYDPKLTEDASGRTVTESGLRFPSKPLNSYVFDEKNVYELVLEVAAMTHEYYEYSLDTLPDGSILESTDKKTELIDSSYYKLRLYEDNA